MGHNKSFLRGKLIALSASKKKLERAHTSSLTTRLKALEQKEANSPKRSRWEEIIKLSGELNQVETRRTSQRINQRRSWPFEKINKIDKPLARLTTGHRGSILIKKIRNEKGDITIDPEEIQNSIRSHLQNLYSTKLENLDEMDVFLVRYQVPANIIVVYTLVDVILIFIYAYIFHINLRCFIFEDIKIEKCYG